MFQKGKPHIKGGYLMYYWIQACHWKKNFKRFKIISIVSFIALGASGIVTYLTKSGVAGLVSFALFFHWCFNMMICGISLLKYWDYISLYNSKNAQEWEVYCTDRVLSMQNREISYGYQSL